MAERRIEKPLAAGTAVGKTAGAPSKTWGDDNGHAAVTQSAYGSLIDRRHRRPAPNPTEKPQLYCSRHKQCGGPSYKKMLAKGVRYQGAPGRAAAGQEFEGKKKAII